MRSLLVVITSILFSGCLLKMGRFEKFEATAPDGLETTGAPVTGESCQWFVPLAGGPSLEAAVRDAIRSAPEGTKGLMDMTVRTTFGLFFGNLCFQVTGTPVK